ncbi:hypothetical protein GE061_019622 [Apolygus lucorum]|uniref:Uncharacterized protein n=1 Tax=Apolygus lucorum TaxID=248454 RepID=A0A6A4JQH8_APOLU|nr:hypothetical protein GE061_019622 [Apolygus lucorum]
MTFFSILWNAILWRRTVKDKKSKTAEKGVAGFEAPFEPEPLNQAEEAEKAFVDVSLHTPAFQNASGFGIDSENDLQDQILIQDVSGLTSPIVAQYLNISELAGSDNDSPSIQTQDVDLAKNYQSNKVSECPHDESLLNNSTSYSNEDLVSSEKDNFQVGKEPNDSIVSDYHSDHLSCHNDPVVEAVIVQSCLPSVLLEELNDNFRVSNENSQDKEDTTPDHGTEPHETVEILSRTPAHELGDHTVVEFSPEQGDLVQETLKVTDSLLGEKPSAELSTLSKHDVDDSLDRPPSPQMSEMNLLHEEMEVNQIIDQIVKSDGDSQVEVMDENVEDILSNDNRNLLQVKEDREAEHDENSAVTNEIDTAAAIDFPNVCNKMDDCSVKVSNNNRVEEIVPDDSRLITEVQASISSVQLTADITSDETVSGTQLPLDYSTNYMVRSDSLVNFLPNAHFSEISDSSKIFTKSLELKDDSFWIGDTFGTIPESNVENASAVVCPPIEQENSCMEEIMCTSTGILKLSDSCGDIRQSNLADVELEENTLIEINKSEQIEESSKVTKSNFLLPCVFRYDVGGTIADNRHLEADAEVAHDVYQNVVSGVLQSDTSKQSTKPPKFDTKGKELGLTIHYKEECNEQSSTKSEDDTMENIDELSFDVNVNINRGDNMVHDIDNFPQKEEFYLDAEPVSRLKSTPRNDLSIGTGTNENMPSLPRSEIYFQGGTNSSGHINENITQNVDTRPQNLMNMRDFKTPEFSPGMSPDVSVYNFPEEFVPQIIPADYNIDNNTVPVSFSVNAVNLDDSIPIVSVGMTNYYGTSKWQEPIPFTAPDSGGTINFDTGGLRFISKNESLFYTHMRPENKSLESGSESYISKVNNELYPFIDGASYLFGIPEEVRKDDYFNPCVGAAPSCRMPGKTLDSSKCEALKVGGFSLDEQNNLVGRREQSWSVGQRLLQNDPFPSVEGIESKYKDGCYRSGMKVQIDSEHLQKSITQPCGVWNTPEQLLPVQKTTSYHNGFESSEQYPQALENVQHHPIDFVPMDYLQSTVYENNQETLCNTTNGYEFINPYGVGVFPMLNLPFCLPDPSYAPRGPLPPFVFPIGPVNMEQNEGPSAQLEPDSLNGLYPLTPHPCWVGFDDNRTQNDISIKNEISTSEINRNFQLPQICINEPVEDHENDNEECPIPDPYFQLAENSSLHSVRSKAESYSGSLFCESLRSILSSHNAESDNVIPSFSCSSMKCYNPSLVVRSCETSLSNDSLPSIIVESSYSKSVDEDYPAKEKFMNDVNTALNESMLDQIRSTTDFSGGFLNHEDFQTEVTEKREDIEKNLQGIMEGNEESVVNNFVDELNHVLLSGDRLEVLNLEHVNVVEDNVNTVIQGSEVIEILNEIMDSVVNIGLERMGARSMTYEIPVLATDDQDNIEQNELVKWDLSQVEKNNNVAQHEVDQFDDVLFGIEESEANESIDIGDTELNGGGVGFDDDEIVNNRVRDEDKISAEEVLGVPFNAALVEEDDDDDPVVDMHAHYEENTIKVQVAENTSRVDDRGGETERGEEIVSCSTEISLIDPNLRKSRRNRRRKKKGLDSIESEGIITAESGIGDGSAQLETIEQRPYKQENHPLEVSNFEHITVPEVTEEPRGEHEDQCREEQDGDYEENDGSLGNSSNNRKRRNRRKKRKN